MCGIFGVYKDLNQEKADKAIALLKHRGSSFKLINEKNKILCHILHPVVNHVQQPLMSKSSVFMANCEIYNWKTLNEKYSCSAKNDAECLFQLLEKKGIAALEEIDGVYALYYEKDNIVILARDILGEKPLCYVHTKDIFAFASEAKALTAYGTPVHLPPDEVLYYDSEKHAIQIKKRQFFTIPKETKELKQEILQKLEKYLIEAVKKRVDGLDNVGILFSGGIDSTIVAFLCKKLGKKVTCYTAGFHDGNTREAPDITQAEYVAKKLGFSLKSVILNLKKTESLIPEVVRIIESRDVVKVGVALPFYCAAELAKHDKQKVLLSGLGSEELFAGYQRHALAENVNQECLSGLTLLWERDLYRDDLITMAHTVELRLPFLDNTLIAYALSIPAEYKISEKQNKIILRDLAVKLGIPEEIAMQKKIAAQYGSNFDKALEKLGKGKKREYLKKI
jgi:asparagine synthase (glutamine-hydrolysing)